MANSRNVLINSRERAVSSDINVLQQFEAESRQDASGAALEQVDADLWARARYTTLAAAGSYLPATVLSGLLVNCDNAGYVTVAPGTVECYAPGLAGANDSDFVVVTDVGVTAITVLLFVANGGAGARIDVVECRPIADPAPGTASRDIYDPVTGLFTPVLVAKYQDVILEYRLRNGAPAGACPAADPDWLPLAVAVVLPGATGYDKCDWYDVRPLAAERVGHLMRAPDLLGATDVTPFELADRHLSVGVNNVGAGKAAVSGYAFGQFAGFKAGGHIRRNAAVSAAAAFGAVTLYTDGQVNYVSMCPDNEAGIWVPAAHGIVQLAALFPGLGATAGPLPRWRRYEQVPAALPRLPSGPNGVLVLITNVSYENRRVLNKALPTPMAGLGNAMGVTLADLSFNLAGTDLLYSAADGRMLVQATPVPAAGVAATSVVGGPPPFDIQFPLLRGALTAGRIPGAARKARVLLQLKFSDGGVVPSVCRWTFTYSLLDAATETVTFSIFLEKTIVVTTVAGDGGACYVYDTIDVPLLPAAAGNTFTAPPDLTMNLHLAAVAGQPNPTGIAADHKLFILGWE